MSRFSTADIPSQPGVYAFHARDSLLWVGYGMSIRERVEHHLLQGEPIKNPGVSQAVAPDPARVTKVVWWLYREKPDVASLEAAWELAVRELSPHMRPRHAVEGEALAHLEDVEFVRRVRARLAGPPDGVFVPQNLDPLTRNVIELEGKVDSLRARLDSGEKQD
jgi:hypothetical protein